MQVRGTFSPIFTSGKMKGMLSFIRITADHLVKEFDKFGEGTEEVDCKVRHTKVRRIYDVRF